MGGSFGAVALGRGPTPSPEPLSGAGPVDPPAFDSPARVRPNRSDGRSRGFWRIRSVPRMTYRTRCILLLVAAVLGVAVAVLGAVTLLFPHVLPHSRTPGLAECLIGSKPAAGLDLAAGLAATAVAVLGLRRRAMSSAGSTTLRVAAVAVVLLVAACTPGGVIPASGYTFVLVVAAGIVTLLVLFVLRHRVAGTVATIVGAGAFVLLWLMSPVSEWVPQVLASLVAETPLLLLSLAHLATAGALAAWVLGDPTARGGLARGVLRHRTALTVAAALCALPYAIARASWLTPWKLLGGELASEAPLVLLTGLFLGAAMVAAGVLTLVLRLPWSERFPRWMAGIGGRAVPVGLVVIPASFVAVLFTAGGWEMVFWRIGSAPMDITTVELVLVLPFWLWGPLLALATWGYAMHRADRAVRDAEQPNATRLSGTIGDPGLSAAVKARMERELELIEEREPRRR